MSETADITAADVAVRDADDATFWERVRAACAGPEGPGRGVVAALQFRIETWGAEGAANKGRLYAALASAGSPAASASLSSDAPFLAAEPGDWLSASLAVAPDDAARREAALRAVGAGGHALLAARADEVLGAGHGSEGWAAAVTRALPAGRRGESGIVAALTGRADA